MKKILTACLALAAAAVHAHGGGLDAQGCHTNRKTGDYHCHRGGSAAAPAPQRPGGAQVQRAAPSYPSQPVCHVGPRGGTYTITPSGRKNYSGC
ncbi:YHYH domain-containing protein [Caenimonas sedimenti]|uniref:YHYH domain-containing protein n=1 Tax=Caenimonas sedimenti TaxID=2596921 RepID=A0A562ZH97_9BURK|nr:YHYH domain-containing protein [Caenimonas sedimenti]TWO67771.1 YHYH domain-containing protein [Caenimonas sedimenti]